MSKEDGDYYGCDKSLRVLKKYTAVYFKEEQHYYVAPIITDEKFQNDMRLLYHNPAKGPVQGSMSTLSLSSDSSIFTPHSPVLSPVSLMWY